MKISNSSWHYRFNRLVQDDSFVHRAECGRFTTCSYVRACIYSLFKGSWNVFLVALMGAILALFVGSAIGVPIAILLGYAPAAEYGIPCVVTWLCVAFAMLQLTLKYAQEAIKNRNRKYHKHTPPKEPNVFFQAIKDKHNKFCTRVEVV